VAGLTGVPIFSTKSLWSGGWLPSILSLGRHRHMFFKVIIIVLLRLQGGQRVSVHYSSVLHSCSIALWSCRPLWRWKRRNSMLRTAKNTRFSMFSTCVQCQMFSVLLSPVLCCLFGISREKKLLYK